MAAAAATVTRKPNIGDVIGERCLVFRDVPRTKLIVTLGKPRRMKGQQDWECPFRIKGAGVAQVFNGTFQLPLERTCLRDSNGWSIVKLIVTYDSWTTTTKTQKVIFHGPAGERECA